MHIRSEEHNTQTKKLLVNFSREAAWERHGKGRAKECTKWPRRGVRPSQEGGCNADESVSKCLSASCRRGRDSGNSFRQMGQLEAAPPPPAVPSPHLFTLTPCRIGRIYFHTYFMAEIRHLVKVRGRLIKKAGRYSAESKRTMDHILYMATAHRGIEENQQPGCWKQLLSTVVIVQSVCVISFFFFVQKYEKTTTYNVHYFSYQQPRSCKDAQNGFHSKSIT